MKFYALKESFLTRQLNIPWMTESETEVYRTLLEEDSRETEELLENVLAEDIL